MNNWSRAVANQIKAIDPHLRHDPGSTLTIEGKINELEQLRFRRAAAYLKIRGEIAPLQVEILRFLQQRTDKAYDKGLALLRAGKLTARLSDREALGNYIDRRVRKELRQRLDWFGISWAGKGRVRINSREYDTSGTDLTYRRPDARIGNVAFDVTLSNKTLATAQVRGFFNADFRPTQVVIIRPRQLGDGYTYVISRPEAKQ